MSAPKPGGRRRATPSGAGGQRAAKTPKPDPFRDYVVDQLRDVQGIAARSMFGGYGLFRDKTFFGVIYGGRLYFKTDESSEPAYRERGMDYFHPKPTIDLKHHFEVPADVLEDSEQLAVWARRALAVKS